MVMTTLFLNVNMSIYRRMLKYILVFPQCTIIYRSSKEVSLVHTNMERLKKNQVAGFMYMSLL